MYVCVCWLGREDQESHLLLGQRDSSVTKIHAVPCRDVGHIVNAAMVSSACFNTEAMSCGCFSCRTSCDSD